MTKPLKLYDLYLGQRVVTSKGPGSVYHIKYSHDPSKYSSATIKLDSGCTGCGVKITEKPYNGWCGWSISVHKNGPWNDGIADVVIEDTVQDIPIIKMGAAPAAPKQTFGGAKMYNCIKKVFGKTVEADAVQEVYGDKVPDTIVTELVFKANAEEVAKRALAIKAARDAKSGTEDI
jgi:hypothetical protein